MEKIPICRLFLSFPRMCFLHSGAVLLSLYMIRVALSEFRNLTQHLLVEYLNASSVYED